MRSGMDLSLSRMGARVLLVAVAVACAGLIGLAAGRRWLASYWGNSHNPTDWERAARLEPQDALYWRQLGLYQEWDFEHGDIQRAIGYFRRATEIDPQSDLYWMDLAGAYETAGEIEKAREAYGKALAAHPASAAVAWRYGSFLLRQGNNEEAAKQVRGALEDQPELASNAVSQFWRAGVNLDQILGEVLPARARDYLAAVNYFVSIHQEDAALAAWKRLAGLGVSFPLNRSFDLINDLVEHNRIDDAAGVWRQALEAAGRIGEAGKDGSLIFNGGFEQDPVNGGFDWRELPADGSALFLVNDVTHGGSRSARVTFDGSANPDYNGLQQYVAVTPGKRYRFSAYMKTDSITTDSGPQFRIVEMGPEGKTLALTPGMTGTHPWTEVQAEFATGADTHGVRVILDRSPSYMFDNKIRGTVWVDDVRMVEVAEAGEAKR